MLVIPITTIASKSAIITNGMVLEFISSKNNEALICAENWIKSMPIMFQVEETDDVKSYKLDTSNILIHVNCSATC